MNPLILPRELFLLCLGDSSTTPPPPPFIPLSGDRDEKRERDWSPVNMRKLNWFINIGVDNIKNTYYNYKITSSCSKALHLMINKYMHCMYFSLYLTCDNRNNDTLLLIRGLSSSSWPVSLHIELTYSGMKRRLSKWSTSMSLSEETPRHSMSWM